MNTGVINECEEEIFIQLKSLEMENKLFKNLVKNQNDEKHYEPVNKNDNLENNESLIDDRNDILMEPKVFLYKPKQCSDEEYNEMKSFLDINRILYKEEEIFDLNVQNPVVYLTPSFYIVGIDNLKSRIGDIKIFIKEGIEQQPIEEEEKNQNINNPNYCSVS